MTIVMIDDSILDISSLVRWHPGGRHCLISNDQNDVTDIFHSLHRQVDYSKYIIDKRKVSIPLYVEELRTFDKWMKEHNWYQPDPWSIFSHLSSKLLFFTIAIYTSLYNNCFLGAVLLGMFWQNSAGLGHDLGHSSVFHSRKNNHLAGSLLISLTGLSTLWWRHSHFQHHIHTNVLTEDPDIVHLPLFAITEKLFDERFHRFLAHTTEINIIGRSLIAIQHVTLYPLLLLARFNLYIQSILHLVNNFHLLKNSNFYCIELLGMLVFLLWYVCLSMHVENTLLYVLVSHVVAGLLHLQIVVSHWVSETYDKDTVTNHYLHTLNTTLDIDCHEHMDWLHLGLQFQVVHHMFPRLPRNRLREATKIVESICHQHSLPYKKVTFLEANVLLIKNMYKVAKQVSTV